MREAPTRTKVDVELVVEAILVGDLPDTIESRRVPAAELDLGGIPGDRHHGITMRSNSREVHCYPRGTEIRNRRQLTIVSVEELEDVARRLDLERLEPEWLGANLVLSGIDALSMLPAGTRLLLPSGAGLVCEGGNAPCRYPGQVVQDRHPDRLGLVKAFIREGYGRRGIIASVERGGAITVGDRARVVAVDFFDTLT